MSARIRLAKGIDAPAITAIYAPYVRDTAISFETDPPIPAEIARRIETGMPAYPWLVAEAAGEVAAFAYAAPFKSRPAYLWTVETTVYVAPERRGAGLGRAVYGALLTVLALQGYCAAVAAITLPNDASAALHEALGFRPVGILRGVGYKLGGWRDTGWWQLGLAEPSGEPALPRPVNTIPQAEWQARLPEVPPPAPRAPAP
jgi:L-amino acid N-acyltransferase YncA